MQVENLSPEVAQQLNLPAGTRGVVITKSIRIAPPRNRD